MKLLHLSDLHYLTTYPYEQTGYKSIFNKMTPPIEKLKMALNLIDEVDVVLISGDLTESGLKSDYQMLKSELNHIFKDIPVIVALGNHDHKQAFYEGWLNVKTKNDACLPYHHVRVVNDVAFITLDNAAIGHPHGKIDQSASDWLELTLKDCTQKKIVLMMHHHLIKEQFSMPPCEYDERFVNIIKDSRIDLILAGHTHHAYQGRFADKLYATTDSLSFSGEDTPHDFVRFEERAGMNVITLANNEVLISSIVIDEEPTLLANVVFKMKK